MKVWYSWEKSKRGLGLQLSECTVLMSEIVKWTKIKFKFFLKESRIHFWDKVSWISSRVTLGFWTSYPNFPEITDMWLHTQFVGYRGSNPEPHGIRGKHSTKWTALQLTLSLKPLVGFFLTTWNYVGIYQTLYNSEFWNNQIINSG